MKAELMRAVVLAIDDRWHEAHEIAQRYESDATACWLHAVLHKIEGDLGNSRYWYRLAGRLDRVDRDAREELEAIRQSLAD